MHFRFVISTFTFIYLFWSIEDYMFLICIKKLNLKFKRKEREREDVQINEIIAQFTFLIIIFEEKNNRMVVFTLFERKIIFQITSLLWDNFFGSLLALSFWLFNLNVLYGFPCIFKSKKYISTYYFF